MSEQTIEALFLEERRYTPSREFAEQANGQPDIYERGFEEFWDTNARERVAWYEPFSTLLEWELPYAKWYVGGKLNVCFNCVDRHVDAGRGGKVAYFWAGEPAGERREVTYAELQRDVVRFANALKELVPGDVITIEPGLYRQGFGGVRLEDLVLVTEDGYENLTDFPYDLTP